MTIKILLIFAVTEFLLSMTPSPAVLLVVSQGCGVNDDGLEKSRSILLT
jgi:threonine/homoserine/homoserine lactone efflux protein